MEDKILLSHGSGGLKTHQLIKELFYKKWGNEILASGADSAVLSINSDFITYTTDAFVVDPVFFPGGNIGKLAICGTVNDLAVMGSRPKYMAVSFIIEEGFSMQQLTEIVDTMADEAKMAQVKIVTGDTKVVDRGKCDKIFITTTGIGILHPEFRVLSEGENIKAGDKIIINGGLGEHGMAVLAARENLQIKSNIRSDCASLNHLIAGVLPVKGAIKFMRDATRGGLATVLCELAEKINHGITIIEDNLPVDENVRGYCELLGFDPLYVANEGKVCLIVDDSAVEQVLSILQKNPLGKNAAVIGYITETDVHKVIMETGIGGKRIISMLEGDQLPRIC